MNVVTLSDPHSKRNLEVRAQQIHGLWAKSRRLGTWPVLLRYTVAALFVAVSYIICATLEGVSDYPLFMFLPPIILSAVLFDRRVGYFATFLSALVTLKFFMALQLPLDADTLVAVTAFILVGLATAYLIDGIRTALDVLAESAALKEEKVKLEQELLHAYKMEAVGRAISILAHDFKNILTPIVTAVEIFRRRASLVDENLLELLVVLENVCRNGNRVVDDIKSFGRKGQAEHVSVNLNKALRENLTTLRQGVKETVALKLELAGNIPDTCVDPALLDRALKNILGNADDAMSDGGTITIRTSRVELAEADSCLWGRCSRGEYVRLAIQDTGTGIPVAIQARIFEPFFTTKPSGQGSGLGMAMVADFVRNAQGCIRVDSRPGAGTTVSLFLPPGTQPRPLGVTRPGIGAPTIARNRSGR